MKLTLSTLWRHYVLSLVTLTYAQWLYHTSFICNNKIIKFSAMSSSTLSPAIRSHNLQQWRNHAASSATTNLLLSVIISANCGQWRYPLPVRPLGHLTYLMTLIKVNNCCFLIFRVANWTNWVIISAKWQYIMTFLRKYENLFNLSDVVSHYIIKIESV